LPTLCGRDLCTAMRFCQRKKKFKRYTELTLAKEAAKHGWSIGKYSYGTPKVWVWGKDGTLKIGKFCSIAEGVEILLGGNHRPDWVTTYPFNAISSYWPEAAEIQGHPATRGDVIIGHDVWIGNYATILSGITIGNGAVIGAGAMVTKDVEPYAIVAGNPARLVRKRFDETTIARLQSLSWWDWPEEKIRRHVRTLQSGDLETLFSVE
jgi:acetyltransferase-like isoleucine patch superfamily enzyme